MQYDLDKFQSLLNADAFKMARQLVVIIVVALVFAIFSIDCSTNDEVSLTSRVVQYYTFGERVDCKYKRNEVSIESAIINNIKMRILL